jgi:hypothetical protein
MELFGTPDTGGKFDPGDGVGRLSETTLILSPAEMRKISQFFAKCADEAEAFELWDHEHYVDFLWEEGHEGPDIIICRAEMPEKI